MGILVETFIYSCGSSKSKRMCTFIVPYTAIQQLFCTEVTLENVKW